jgi:ATP-binding cassette subfamily A (ABC1) protein 3
MPNFSFSVIMLEFYIKGGPKLLFGLDVTVAWWSLVLATPFYLLVYMYLDGIIPNAFGIRESPLFCFKCRNKRALAENLENDNHFQDSESLINPQSVAM